MTRICAAWLLLLMGLCVALPSRAQESAQSCDQLALDTVGRFLHVDNFRIAGYQNTTDAVVGASCKTWPKDENIELVAAAYMLSSDPSRNDDQADRHFVVVMVDTSSWTVVRSFKGTIVQDVSLRIRGSEDFRLDTARYDLAPGVRAFGVVFVGGKAPRGADGRWDSHYLVLFVPDGQKLRQVLLVPLEQTEGKDTTYLTIGVEKTGSHGFADLWIDARSDGEGGQGRSEGRTIIHYNGRSYEGQAGLIQSGGGEIFQP